MINRIGRTFNLEEQRRSKYHGDGFGKGTYVQLRRATPRLWFLKRFFKTIYGNMLPNIVDFFNFENRSEHFIIVPFFNSISKTQN
jgi:hypothetical protein